MAVEIHQVHRFSVEEYHQLVEAGGFDARSRVELIEGVISDMSPKTREHELAILWLSEWLFTHVDLARFQVAVQLALTLEDSEPEPDLAVIPRDAPRPYHAGTAALVIEVTVSSQHRDLRQKPRLYARAQVPEYWVIELDHRRAVVHRDVTAEGYATVLEVGASGRLAARALKLADLPLAELLAACSTR